MDTPTTGTPLVASPSSSSAPTSQRIRVQVPERKACVVLVPVGGPIEPACEAGLQALERKGYAVWRLRGCSAIDQARNQLATDALARGYDETMWIDSDVQFDPDDVDRLRCLNLPTVGGIYPKKARRELAVHVLPGTRELVFGQRGGVVEVKYTATGFLHVRREVYETIQRQLRLPVCNAGFGKPMIPYFQPLVAESERGPWYLAEDFAFCERARQCGFRILADTRVRLYHIGSYAYGWEDAGSEPQRFTTYGYRVSDEAER